MYTLLKKICYCSKAGAKIGCFHWWGQGNLPFSLMGTLANCLRKLGINVDSGEQFRMYFKRTLKTIFRYKGNFRNFSREQESTDPLGPHYIYGICPLEKNWALMEGHLVCQELRIPRPLHGQPKNCPAKFSFFIIRGAEPSPVHKLIDIFWKVLKIVANLSFNHAHIHWMINYSVNSGPKWTFFQNLSYKHSFSS